MSRAPGMLRIEQYAHPDAFSSSFIIISVQTVVPPPGFCGFTTVISAVAVVANSIVPANTAPNNSSVLIFDHVFLL